MPSVSSILASVCVLTSTVLADVGVFFTSSANFCSESLPLNGLGLSGVGKLQLLDQPNAYQDVGDVVQSTDFGCCGGMENVSLTERWVKATVERLLFRRRSSSLSLSSIWISCLAAWSNGMMQSSCKSRSNKTRL